MIYVEYIKTGLAIIIAAGCGYSIYALFCMLRFFPSQKGNVEAMTHIPVSVLKPVKGLDPDFRENIESFCRQDYPEYEVLLGFTDEDDEAIKVALEIADSIPDGKVRIVVGNERIGVNIKVSNLQGLLNEAKYPLLAISDSDMRVGVDYLNTIVREYQSSGNVGLVTSLYKISNPASSGAALESLTIAVDFIPSVLVARQLEGITFGLGASMLLSKEAIESIGGLKAIADYLADDYQIGNRLWKKGRKIILSNYVVEDVAGDMAVSEYFVHQLRWARTYRASRPWGFFGYGITHVFPLSLLLITTGGPTVFSLSVMSAALLLRLALAWAAYRYVIHSGRWLGWLYLLPLKDVSAFAIWAWGFAGRKVLWRGTSYLIEKGGLIKQAAARRPLE
jgi:ceramide glucosyltransferase